MRISRTLILAGALLAATGVSLGAFGTHGLQAVLDERRLSWWQTGVEYQIWHGLALVALAPAGLSRIRLVAALLVGGALLFSGSLCLMALTDWRWLGPVTPIGGSAMIAGWLVLAWSAITDRRSDD
jgi:uncharacterized membrane protein YgdD (TMEM256/DUF423 family)